MLNYTKFLVFLSLLIIQLPSNSSAQNNQITLILSFSDQNSSFFNKRFKNEFHLPSIVACHERTREILWDLIDDGFVTARLDSFLTDSLHCKACIYIGKQYNLITLDKGNIDKGILSEINFKEKLYQNTTFKYQEIRMLVEEILAFCENNGYPFASISIKEMLIDSNTITGSLNLVKNNKITIDSIIVKGNASISNTYLQNYLGIKPSDLYDESLVKKIGKRINELSFLQEIKPFVIGFTQDKAKIILYLNKKRSSQFDGILGIAPNDDAEGKLLLTGDIKLKLLSAFNRGELIDFNWRKLEAKTQDLNFHFNFPFLFNTPFGFDYQLQLFKKDTSYLTLTNNLGIQVLFNGYNHVKAFYENQTSNLLSTEGLEFATTLPEYADITTSLYGLGMGYSKLDYRYNPQKGYHFDLSGAIGSKKIRKNSNVNQALYDSIPLSSTLYRLHLDAALFIPLFRSSTLMIGNQSGYLENENLFENELYRIGGLKTLRGFDEESITASAYSIFTLEFRYLFDVNSFFHLFFDGAFYERNANSGYFRDTPYGVGAGVNFETRAGIFALSYALGSSEGHPFQFKSAKIHFGLMARF